ncbi:hypothetical protein [Nostoc sp. TCL26-01]|uniref:hypothetical protein n=1 Tax=Nostoc sp. TCL26-01 TaxID=2576904 RepID=UPI0015C13325|nr:hypothetical protein [Nostoc sp. TCL26-01]QLE54828.1 hypothetical protein FD725_04440 [Nostoc sp. TCL26-01]QLE58756.1 hypothetical protein FD725_26585 [Nostoc sp. TCL26-01]
MSGGIIPAGYPLTVAQKKNLEYFDSALEFKVWGHLRKKYGATYINRQFEIPLLPQDECFPALTWKCDFSVFTPSGLILFEAKGEWILHDDYALADFRKTLRLLQLFHPDYFNYLRLVSDKPWKLPGSNLTVIGVGDI